MGYMDQQSNELERDEPHPSSLLDFKNTEIAFANKSNKELKKTAWLFRMMNNNTLVNLGSSLALYAVKLRLPFADFAIKSTIFDQFCGGENLLDTQKSIDKLYKNEVLTILDYGAEGKTSEDDLDVVKNENIKSIEMAASNNSVPGIGVKLTGLVENEILEKLNNGKKLDTVQQGKYQRFLERIDEICAKAHEHGVGVFIDAEESWIQIPIDSLTLELMEKYNQEKVIVFNTYQLYRHDKLKQLKDDYQMIRSKGLLFGAKLVRGAYMEKENEKAKEEGYVSPIHTSKPATDKDFDLAVEFCVDNYETLSFVCASHNLESNLLLANLIKDKGLDKSHAHLNFCQLYGMSDYITYNLAQSGYNVAKYVPYGPVKEVIPYLIRRAQENTSVTGEMGRELSLVQTELQRRGL